MQNYVKRNVFSSVFSFIFYCWHKTSYSLINNSLHTWAIVIHNPVLFTGYFLLLHTCFQCVIDLKLTVLLGALFCFHSQTRCGPEDLVCELSLALSLCVFTHRDLHKKNKKNVDKSKYYFSPQNYSDIKICLNLSSSGKKKKKIGYSLYKSVTTAVQQI